MNEDRDYMKEAADMLRSGCRMRMVTDDNGELACDCPFLTATADDGDGWGWHYCYLTESEDALPMNWRIK